MKRTQQSFNSTFKPRASGLCKESRNRRRAKAAQSKAYAAADDAEQAYCSACGVAGHVEHSHILSQGRYPEHRNNPLNWLQFGKHCGCHTCWENSKRAFAERFPAAYAESLRRMGLIDPAALAFFLLKNPPGGPLSLV